MKDLEIIDEHYIIRETIGYSLLNKIELEDIPEVVRFLKIVYNYKRMKKLLDNG